MSCYCDYDRPKLYTKAWKKAAKSHRCCECGYTIKKGETYETVQAVYEDGPFHTFKTCERCVDLRDSLGDCYEHRGLFNDYSEQIRNDEQVQKVLDKHRNYNA